MNIKRKWFAAIVAGEHPIEYRRRSRYWRWRIEPLTAPFKLRLINGMIHPIPEAEVIVNKVTTNRSGTEYRLHLGRVLRVRRWDKKARQPR
jgi:hypothetical protein